MEIQIGDIVRSLAGRDKNNLFFVVSIKDDYVFLVDGIIRKLVNLKKKKIKHVVFCKRDEDSVVQQKILKGLELNDAQIRKEIRIQDNSVGGYVACQKKM